MIIFLFYKVYYSYILGDLNSTKMYYSFLQEEFKKKGDPKALSIEQLHVLKKIKSAIESGKVEKCAWVSELEQPHTLCNDNLEINQKILVKKIHLEGISYLKNILNNDNLELYGLEFPCGPYGAVDMVYHDKDIMYPTEIKIHEGKHDLIGQISKYDLFFRLRLHYNLYNKVQPVTICNSYNKHTLAELKKASVLTIIYNIVNNKIFLSKV